MSNKNKIKLLFGVLSILLIDIITGAPRVSAVISGSGATAGFDNAACNTFQHGYYQVCSGQTAGGNPIGGASWHLYKRSTIANSMSSYLGYSGNIMKGSGSQEALRQKIINACPSSVPWVAIYGWDGRAGSSTSKTYVHYGPINYPGHTPSGAPIQYNDNGAVPQKSDFNDNNLVDGIKISEQNAQDLYKDNNNGAGLPSNDSVGFFCVDDPIDIFSQTNVSDGDAKYETTNITGPGTNAERDVVIDLEVGQSTPLIFSHNIYSSAKVHGLYWQVQKSVEIDGKAPGNGEFGMWRGETLYSPSKYTIGNYTEAEGYTGSNLDIDYQLQPAIGRAAWTASSRPYADNANNRYFYRDSYNSIKFNQEGKYRFCETIYLNDIRYTQACATVNVGPVSSYLSKSNVSAGDGYASTDISSSPTTATTNELKIDKNGGKANITFSHNIYSTVIKENIPYKIVRSVDGTSGLGSFANKTATPSSKEYSSNEKETSTSGYANFSEKSDEYFIGNPRNYSDGKYKYILRDNYEITFSSSDHGSHLFCETVYIDEEEFTTSCALVTVGDSTPIPSVPNTQSQCSLWTPSTYTDSTANHGTTSVIASVKNPEANFNDWIKSSSSVVYAKPYDTTKWLHCYYPGVQSVANTLATKTHKRHSGNDNTNVNQIMSSWGNWGNYFNITHSGFVNDGRKKLDTLRNGLGPFAKGDTTIQSWEDSYKIPSGVASRAGEVLTETNTSSTPKEASVSSPTNCPGWDCHCHRVCETSCGESGCSTSCHTECDTCYHTNEYIANSRDNSPAKDTATVYVPYNYSNSITVGISSGVVFAGETVTIKNAEVKIGTKPNGTTNGEYATRVNGSEVKLVGFISGTDQSNSASSISNSGGYGTYSSPLCSAVLSKENCAEIDVDYGTTSRETGCNHALNCDENTGGTTEQKFTNHEYNVFDVPAGKWYCVVAAVYPANSGDSTSMNGNVGNAGNNKWAFSTPDCVQIAKRPSIQVWGGGMFTDGKVALSTANKRTVDGINELSFDKGYNGVAANSDRNTIVFGSWVEQNIIANKEISGMASGASTGNYNSSNSRTPHSGLGGSKEGSGVSICIRSPLTFSNSPCSTGSNTTGSLVSNSTASTTPSDKSALLSRFTSPSQNYDLIEHTGDYTINDANGTVPSTGQTRIIKATGTININTNLQYGQEVTYASTVEIPKLIIYANKIIVSCNVEHIDAVLISNTEVDTCTSDQNSRENSIQLKIFGTVITDSLKANRTYGAATGTNSTVPAEIIDYDTSLYLWGAPRADASASGKLDITYQTELAPRY